VIPPTQHNAQSDEEPGTDGGFAPALQAPRVRKSSVGGRPAVEFTPIRKGDEMHSIPPDLGQRWKISALGFALLLGLLSSQAVAQNGVGPDGFSLEIIAFHNCPDGDFTGSNRRMIAVEADYQYVESDIKSNQHHNLVKDLVRNNTIALTPGDHFQVLDGNACGAGKQDAELMLPITAENCDPCTTDAALTDFTEYRVELALVGAPGSGIGVSTCGTEPVDVDVDGDGNTDQILCTTEENVLVRYRKNGKPIWEDVSTQLLTVCLDIDDTPGDDVDDLDGLCDQRVGIFDPLLYSYLWQWNTNGKAHAKLRFKPVPQE
jgi:hypothetical protein